VGVDEHKTAVISCYDFCAKSSKTAHPRSDYF
jgi:hypothetical protein